MTHIQKNNKKRLRKSLSVDDIFYQLKPEQEQELDRMPQVQEKLLVKNGEIVQ